ncbi:MAG: DUF1573 domain-containing protein [Bacteroidales bacterium]|nr:DUF1573 domain-containing protein [Bacteroidales bacterium]
MFFFLKKINSLFIVLLFWANGFAQNNNQIIFDNYEWNFGTIEEVDGSVSHTFILMNNSKKDVTISKIIPSCSCISTNYSHEIIQPGKIGEIDVTFTPSGSVGETFRSLEVFDNEGVCIGVLEIKTFVNPSNRSIQERYFYTLSDFVYASRININFGYLFKNQQITKSFYLANSSSNDISISIDKSQNKYLKIEYPKVLKPNDEKPVSITYLLSDDNFYSTFVDTFYIFINNKKALLPITTKALALKKYDSIPNPPMMRTYPSIGKLNGKKIKSGEIEIYNDGNSNLEIYQVEIPNNAKTNLIVGTIIKPHEKFIVKCEVLNDNEYQINIFTNDLIRPYKELIFK